MAVKAFTRGFLIGALLFLLGFLLRAAAQGPYPVTEDEDAPADRWGTR